jgi:tetrapyrrole methylase family protein/MazG family protein
LPRGVERIKQLALSETYRAPDSQDTQRRSRATAFTFSETRKKLNRQERKARRVSGEHILFCSLNSLRPPRFYSMLDNHIMPGRSPLFFKCCCPAALIFQSPAGTQALLIRDLKRRLAINGIIADHCRIVTQNETNPETKAFARLIEIVARLRGPGGCPWDREQTPSTLRGGLVEETYECVEAIDEKDPGHIAEELGDLFLLVTMLSYMHQQENLFTIADVLDTVCDKLIRRHPHVFGELKVKDSAEVLDNWAKIKVQMEGRRPKDSIIDEVSAGLPPLDRAWKLQKKAAKAGFDWPDIAGVTAKIREELEETEEAARNETAEALETELGDLLFSVVNLCRFLKVEPSLALRRTNEKFVSRFRYVEKKMKETGREMKKENLAVMDGYWNDAKNKHCIS